MIGRGAVPRVKKQGDKERAEAKLRTCQKRLRSLAQQFMLAEERERRRVARELHDGVCQILAVVQMKMDMLRAQVATGAATGTGEALDDIQADVERAANAMRAVMVGLSPAGLNELGFEAAVEWLAEQMQSRHNVAVETASEGKRARLGSAAQALLFQVTRELLLDAVAEGGARAALVKIVWGAKAVVVEVAHDGSGRAAAGKAARPAADGSRELFAIRERLGCLGGRLRLAARSGHRAYALVTVPFSGTAA